MVMGHSHTCQGPPMVSRAMTSHAWYDDLKSSVRDCLDFYYPSEALHMDHPMGLDKRARELNRASQDQLLCTVKVCASVSCSGDMPDRLSGSAAIDLSASY